MIATGIPLTDLIATATEFTVAAAAQQINRVIKADEILVSGGGVHNPYLMHRLRRLTPGATVLPSSTYGINPDAKEAIAFAVLAYESARRQPANLPSATGARRAVVLGKRTC